MKIGNNCNISSTARWYNDHMIVIGDNVRIDDFCILSGGSGIRIGNNTHISSKASLFGGSGIIIEDDVHISTNVQLFSESNDFSDTSYQKGMIHIGRYAIIGSGSIVMPGVTVGAGASIGAMSFVKHDCEPWSIYAGIPAIRIKERIKDKYAFIVTACKKYIPEINALLNSLDFVCSNADIHLWYYEFPQDYLDKITTTDWCFNLILHQITYEQARMYGGESEELCRKRYWYAGEIGKEYEAVCILDADMVFVRNPCQFFAIAASTGFLIGVHKEQNKRYDDDHHKLNGKFLYDPTFTNDKDLCNAPLFIDARLHERCLKRSWEIFIEGYPDTNFKAPDMDAINIAFLEAGLHDKIIKLSNHSWLGTNESMLKPYTKVCGRDDGGKYMLWTQNGQEVFSFHGQYYKENWRKVQLDNRSRCAMGYLGCNEQSDSIARSGMDTLYDFFKKMCFDWKVTIPLLNYVHPELPYDG